MITLQYPWLLSTTTQSHRLLLGSIEEVASHLTTSSGLHGQFKSLESPMQVLSTPTILGIEHSSDGSQIETSKMSATGSPKSPSPSSLTSSIKNPSVVVSTLTQDGPSSSNSLLPPYLLILLPKPPHTREHHIRVGGNAYLRPRIC